MRATEPESSGRAAPGAWRRVAVPTSLLAIGMAIGATVARVPISDPAVDPTLRMRTPRNTASGIEWLDMLGIGSLTWYACALSIPLFVWLARRFPIGRREWRVGVLVHAAVVLVLVVLTALVFRGVNEPAGDATFPIWRFLRIRLITQTLPFIGTIAVVHALVFHQRAQEREVEAARLATQLAQWRLDALAAQLHPHFLFNTLQGISTLMHRDVNAADTMLSGLSDLLRQTLARGDRRHEVPLGEELAMLRNYVAISRERFGDRLTFEVHVPEALHGALVPFFVFQPLVENALEHGIASRQGAARVEVRAMRRDGLLELTVADDGPGLRRGTSTSIDEGIGLSNTRSRLQQLYGGQQSLAIESPEGGGLRLRVTIPFHEESASDAPPLGAAAPVVT